MNIAFLHWGLAAILLLGATDSLFAQGVTVQQPVVQVFSVDTVVSVPDRGSAYLGGVSSAAEGRGDHGLFPLGSNSGLSRSHTGVSTGVYIHDFEAMDEYLLTQPAARERRTWVNSNCRAASAFDSLRDGQVASRSSRGIHEPAASPSVGSIADRSIDSQPAGPPQTDDPTVQAEFYLSRARDAEQSGKGGVAMLCYRMAARHGSALAHAKLREMDGVFRGE